MSMSENGSCRECSGSNAKEPGATIDPSRLANPSMVPLIRNGVLISEDEKARWGKGLSDADDAAFPAVAPSALANGRLFLSHNGLVSTDLRRIENPPVEFDRRVEVSFIRMPPNQFLLSRGLGITNYQKIGYPTPFHNPNGERYVYIDFRKTFDLGLREFIIKVWLEGSCWMRDEKNYPSPKGYSRVLCMSPQKVTFSCEFVVETLQITLTGITGGFRGIVPPVSLRTEIRRHHRIKLRPCQSSVPTLGGAPRPVYGLDIAHGGIDVDLFVWDVFPPDIRESVTESRSVSLE